MGHARKRTCTGFADKHCKLTRKGFAVHSGWHVFLEYAGIIGVFIFVKVLGRVKLFGGGVRLMGKGGFFWSDASFGV